jgi:hypothetical protein
MHKTLQRAATRHFEIIPGLFHEPTREAYHIQAIERQDEPAKEMRFQNLQ